MLGSNTVCNLNPILLTRLIFGYNFKIASPKIRIISKAYITILVASLLYLFHTENKSQNYVIKLLVTFEYLIYVIQSLKTNDENLLSAYKNIAVIDTLPCAKIFFKRLGKFLVGATVTIVALRIASAAYFCYNFYDICFIIEPLGCIFTYTLVLATDLRHINLILFFSLLRVRAKIFKNTLECNGFDRFPSHRFSPRKYIYMYQALVDSLEYLDLGEQSTVFVGFCCSIIRCFYRLFLRMIEFKQNEISLWRVSSVIIDTQHTFIGLTVASIALDLIQDDVNTIKTLTIERSIKSNNERERAELKLLLEVMDQHPLQYRLMRIFPLSLYFILSFVSFFILNMIAMVQIKLYF